jgi:4-amino-4-deoxy-L-arabinose transferase-like glycosyltransferase
VSPLVFVGILALAVAAVVGLLLIAEAMPVVAAPVWLTLGVGVGGLVVVLTALLFADPRERLFVQASLLVAVTLMVVTGLLLVWFLDHPYEDAAGSIKSVQMQRTIEIIQDERPGPPRLCHTSGNPRPA